MAIETPETRFERWRTRGDGAALADVFDALAPGLLRLAIHLVGDPAAAEDLVQQTFVTAMERAASWDVRRPLEPWLQGILANHARDLKKSARRAHDPDFDLATVLAREEDAPLESASRRELSGELARAVDALEEPYRAAVLLRLRHGMEAADIAHVLGRSPGAVRVQLHRAREMLRKTLPASIASALLLLAEPARGLECARNQTLEHAARLAPAASTSGGLLGGAIVMKKLVIAAAIVVVGIATFLVTRSSDPVEPVSAPLAATAIDRGAPTSAEARVEPLEPAVTREREVEVEVVVTPPPSANEILRGIVLDANTDAPIAGARIALHTPRYLSLREVRTRWWDRFQVMSDGALYSAVWPHLDDDPNPAQRAGLEPIRVRVPPDAGMLPIAETTSGADGRFELEAASVDGLLVCEADGYARREIATLQRDVVPDMGSWTVYLARSVALRARIVDASGAPIRESIPLSLLGYAPMTLLDKHDPLREPQPRSVTVRSDIDGRFETPIDAHSVLVKSLDPRFMVDGLRRGNSKQTSQLKSPWFDLLTESGDAFVVLRPVPSLLVRDAVTRAPIEEAYVTIQDDFAPILRTGWFHLEGGRLSLDEDRGYFTHRRDRQRGEMVCSAWAPGYARAAVVVTQAAESAVIELDLVRDESGLVRGTITRSGSGAVGARILAYGSHLPSAARSEGGAPIAGVIANDVGGFELELPDGRHLLSIEYDGKTVRHALDVPHPELLAIELDATASIRVHVTEPDGGPAARRDIRAVDDAGVQTKGTTDARGVVELVGLAPGRQRVQLSHHPSGASFWAHQELDVVLAGGGLVELAFTAPSNSPRYARLVVEDGTVEGWKVQQSPWRGPRVDVDPSGRVPFDLVEDRTFIAVSPAGTLTWILMPENAPDGSEVRVQNGGLGYRGRVIDLATGEPAHDLYVWFRGEGDEASKPPSKLVDLDDEGRFEVRGLASAEYSITVVSRDGRSSTLSGNLDFEPDAPPADPPPEIVLRRPRFVGGDYEGLPGVALHGRIVGKADDMIGGMVFVSTRISQDGCSLWIHDESRLQADGTFRMRMRSSQEAKLAVWTGTNPPRPLLRETWRPSGADPEVREFVLKP